MTTSQKVLAAVLAGAAAGLIAGILVAPDKGSETRRKIGDAARNAADSVRDFAGSAMSTANGIREKYMGKKNRESYEETVADSGLV